jgi:hypothetical protein
MAADWGNSYVSKLNDRVAARDAAFSAMSRQGRAPRRRESLVEEESTQRVVD